MELALDEAQDEARFTSAHVTQQNLRIMRSNHKPTNFFFFNKMKERIGTLERLESREERENWTDQFCVVSVVCGRSSRHGLEWNQQIWMERTKQRNLCLCFWVKWREILSLTVWFCVVNICSCGFFWVQLSWLVFFVCIWIQKRGPLDYAGDTVAYFSFCFSILQITAKMGI